MTSFESLTYLTEYARYWEQDEAVRPQAEVRSQKSE